MTTELEAVNLMLSAIGQVPVAAISTVPVSDSAIALKVLQEYTESIQLDGYDFNTVLKEEWEPDVNRHIEVPTGVVRVKSHYESRRISVKNGRLYDVINNTDEFDNSVFVDYITTLPYSELPLPLQRYVVIRAARVFGNRTIGDQAFNSYTAEDESRARLVWMNSVAEDTHQNVLGDRYGAYHGSYRPSNITRSY